MEEEEPQVETEDVKPEQIRLTDPRSQAHYDGQILDETMNQLRGLLASAKVNMRLAQEGLLESDRDLHPEKFKAAIAKHSRAIKIVQLMYDELGDEGLPMPSALEVPRLASR